MFCSFSLPSQPIFFFVVAVGALSVVSPGDPLVQVSRSVDLLAQDT